MSKLFLDVKGGGGGGGGGVACDANFFVYCFLFVNYSSKISLQLCQLYSTGHFIAEMTLYQILESGKDT